jgi:hypothetical protein
MVILPSREQLIVHAAALNAAAPLNIRTPSVRQNKNPNAQHKHIFKHAKMDIK